MNPEEAGLRERLIEAKLAGSRLDESGYVFRSNEAAARKATKVVAAWLREEATRSEYCGDVLDALADTLDPKEAP